MGRRADEGKILDRAGPGDLGVIEGVIALGTLDIRERHDNESNMPERGGENSAARDAALDPGILEKTCREQASGDARATEEFGKVAGDALVELSPADVELRLGGAVELRGGRDGHRDAKKIERILGRADGQFLLWGIK